jgi:hypothetical protein
MKWKSLVDLHPTIASPPGPGMTLAPDGEAALDFRRCSGNPAQGEVRVLIRSFCFVTYVFLPTRKGVTTEEDDENDMKSKRRKESPNISCLSPFLCRVLRT